MNGLVYIAITHLTLFHLTKSYDASARMRTINFCKEDASTDFTYACISVFRCKKGWPAHIKEAHQPEPFCFVKYFELQKKRTSKI